MVQIITNCYSFHISCELVVISILFECERSATQGHGCVVDCNRRGGHKFICIIPPSSNLFAYIQQISSMDVASCSADSIREAGFELTLITMILS